MCPICWSIETSTSSSDSCHRNPFLTFRSMDWVKHNDRFCKWCTPKLAPCNTRRLYLHSLIRGSYLTRSLYLHSLSRGSYLTSSLDLYSLSRGSYLTSSILLGNGAAPSHYAHQSTNRFCSCCFKIHWLLNWGWTSLEKKNCVESVK